MMKSKFFSYAVRMCTAFAMALAILNVNAACMDIFHQAKIPDALLKYKR